MSEQHETNPVRAAIVEAIAEHEVILFMKGTPERPACGFSARTGGALQALGVPFAGVDVLPDPRIRQELSAISQWPTIPQLFVRGELVGGCDIVMEMYESGELGELLGAQEAGAGSDDEPKSAQGARAEDAASPARSRGGAAGAPQVEEAAPLQIENRLA